MTELQRIITGEEARPGSRNGFATVEPDAQRQLVRDSGLFDPVWYLERYPDVKEAGVDPLDHYLRKGAFECRNPSPCFDSKWYLGQNPDVRRIGCNPLLHYLEFGRNESRAPVDPYPEWIKLYDTITDDDRKEIAEAVTHLVNPPLISVVMPVYETPERYLRAAIDSVRRQLYPYWELCIADDASSSDHVRSILEEYKTRDWRIKTYYRSENGHISATLNTALALAQGSFVALLDHDDLLPEHALYTVAAAVDANPDIDVVYSDEDRIDADGRRYEAHFKSDWNPDLLLSQNMVSHLGVYRRSLIEKLGGFRIGYEGAQDYDLILRAQNVITSDRILHLPYVLYHWRSAPSSTAFDANTKPYALINARKAIVDYLAQQDTVAEVLASPHPVFSRVRYPVPCPRPLVSLIIPTGERTNLLRTCVSGILAETDYDSIELIIIHNTQNTSDLPPYFEQIARDPRVTVLDIRMPFNFSHICNIGAAQAKGEIIGFINDDIEIIEPGWLEEMVGHALRSEIGAVGALLHYPDDHIQHGGCILGLGGGVAWHAHHGLSRSSFGYFGRAALVQNLSAVTAACLIMRKTVFEVVGGFNQDHLAIAYNDVDLCLRVAEAGYRVVWTPHAELRHHESASRGPDTEPEKVRRLGAEADYMYRRWEQILDRGDPYYNPNLRLDGPSFSLAFPPRIVKPWRRSRRYTRSEIREPDLSSLRGAVPRGSIAVVLHLFDVDLWDEMREAIGRIRQPFDLFVSVTTGSSGHMRTSILENFPHAYVFEFEDHGRDLGPFITFLQSGVLFRYDLVCKLHTKRSTYLPDGDEWRRTLIRGVLGSSQLVDQIVSAFQSDPDLGMVVSAVNIYHGWKHWVSCEKRLAKLLPRLGIAPEVAGRSFPGGSIFWIRSFLLRTLSGAGISLADFEPEPLKTDGSFGHAVERMFGLICEDAGMRVAEHTRLTEASRLVPHRRSDTHLVAFYLPQFHPVAENDEWWGEGFTEWTNVTDAKPLFPGHRQPRLPADLGFYDLRVPEVREAQAKLAHQYGLDAFCYHYYWFNGRRVLERPLDEVLASGKPDFSFMICWANEPWTRNWDGLNSEILLPQTYEPGWATRFGNEVARLMRDRRYFRFNGEPMLLIYRVAHIPEVKGSLLEIRTALSHSGVPKVHLAAPWLEFAGDDKLPENPSELGLDAYVEFPPHMLPMEPLRLLTSEVCDGYAAKIWDYNRIVTAALTHLNKAGTGRRHRGVMAGWDNTARRRTHANVFHGATPANFRRWIRGVIRHESREPGERVIFINAWNEWAEGTYLEPDRTFGRGWLEAVASAAERPSS